MLAKKIKLKHNKDWPAREKYLLSYCLQQPKTKDTTATTQYIPKITNSSMFTAHCCKRKMGNRLKCTSKGKWINRCNHKVYSIESLIHACKHK